MLPIQTISKYLILLVFGFLISGDLVAQKRPDSIVTYSYPVQGDSVNWMKITNGYNGAGQKTDWTIFIWDTGLRRWIGWMFPCEECAVNPGRYQYDYDENGNLLWTSGFEWGGPSAGWVLRSLTDNIYDDHGNKLQSISCSWNITEGKLVTNVRSEFAYDEDDRMVSSVVSLFNLSQQTWHPMEKMLYGFDRAGSKTMECRQQWVDSISDWANKNKTEWYPDTAGIKTEIATFSWVRVNDIFDWRENGRHKVVNDFDSAGNRILTTDYQRVTATRWTAVNNEERQYNSAGQPVLSVISKGSGALTETFRSEWAYDPSGRLILETQSGLMQRRPGYSVNDNLKVIRSFDDAGDIDHELWYHLDPISKSYLFVSKDYYFYTPASGTPTEPVMEPVRIYPNPFRGFLRISGLSGPANVKIYSMQGLLLRSVLDTGPSVDVSGLPAGVYLFEVSTGDRPLFRTVLIRE